MGGGVSCWDVQHLAFVFSNHKQGVKNIVLKKQDKMEQGGRKKYKKQVDSKKFCTWLDGHKRLCSQIK